jgi:hypothetical protein
MFKDGRTNEQIFKMKSKVVGQSSVVNDDLFQSVDQKICEKKGASLFQNFRVNFQKFHAIFWRGLA